MKVMLKDELIAEIDAIRSKIIEISDTVHEYAELGYREYKSSALLANELRKYGFDVEKPVGSLETAFKATLQGKPGGPVVAFDAEYDALPGLGHACGHNLIAAVAVGAAMGLSRLMKDLQGTVVVMGTPAEEAGAPGVEDKGGGKILLLDAWAWDGIDVAMICHAGENYAVARTCNSVRLFWVRMKGRRHEGRPRYDVVSALDMMELFLHGLNIMRLRVSPETRIQSIVTRAGETPNVVPVETVAKVWVRAGDDKYVEELVERMRNVARGAALACGGEAEVTQYGTWYKRLVQNLTLEELVKRNMETIGLKSEPPDRPPKASHGTDFGNISQVIPAISFRLGMGPGLPLHTVAGTKATISEAAHKAVINGAKVMAMTALDLFNNPGLVKKAKEELAEYQRTEFSTVDTWHTTY
ncbi:MAG: M20 family metallopeptidase [Candidatus Bathyarchaeia archaeon]